jgi:hypothetical protein
MRSGTPSSSKVRSTRIANRAWTRSRRRVSFQRSSRHLGSRTRKQKLHQEAVKEAPAPEKPAEPDEDGEWGVYYLYEHTEHDPKTGQWVDEWREVVVPYYDLDDAQRAYELSKSLIEDWDRQEHYPDYFIVHRASPEWTAEQRFLRKQQGLFDEELMPFKDPALDIWRRWDDEEDEEDDDE